MERLPKTVLGSGIFKKKVIYLHMSSFGLMCQKEGGGGGGEMERKIEVCLFSHGML